MSASLYSHHGTLYYASHFVEECVKAIVHYKTNTETKDHNAWYTFIQNMTEQAVTLSTQEAKSASEIEFCAEVLCDDLYIPCAVPFFLSKLYDELAKAQKHIGRIQEAEANLRIAISLHEHNIIAKYNLAELFFDSYDFAACADLCEQILIKDPKHVATVYLLALSLSSQGKPEKALPYFQKTVELDNDSMGGHYWSAECLLHAGNYAEALPHFKRSYELSHTHHKESARGYAICELICGKASISLEICDRLLAEDPTNQFVAMQIKGDALVSLGRIEEGAVWHRDLARIELDARNFVIGRGHRIAKEFGRDTAKRYVDILLEAFPDMHESFSFLNQSVEKAPSTASAIKSQTAYVCPIHCAS